jgi:hypothetical protein
MDDMGDGEFPSWDISDIPSQQTCVLSVVVPLVLVEQVALVVERNDLFY